MSSRITGKWFCIIIKSLRGLNEERALVQEVSKAHRLQDMEVGEAQDATKQRDAKIEELEEWMSDFRAIARIAPEDHP